ncbi:MAG: sulfotransferase domain-containing protein [Pseudomonadota bacterium]|nr:sulfotransferase domain-containing protein [Pseudomonadota bacterium]
MSGTDDMSGTRDEAGIPWILPAIQQDIAWRDGDIVISVPAKSGTTWTMNIVHQLLNAGCHAFEDIYAEVPWIEFLRHPGDTPADVHARLCTMPADRPRAFKTHSPPPVVPYLDGRDSAQVRYIVVLRNPEEALVSVMPFLAQHTDAWFDLWGLPRNMLCRSDFATFYADIIAKSGMHAQGFFGFLNVWWPLRAAPNVLFLHFGDMKRDHAGTIHKVADFLGISLDDAAWSRVLEYTSFAWMKAHQSRFELPTVCPSPVLGPGAMIRKGETGHAREDGMTASIAADLRRVGEATCPDPAALEWYYTGGPLP